MSMGDRIKERREFLGMTRDELAEKIGVAKTAIGNYETNYSFPRIDVLYKLFGALQCDANYLYQDEMNELRNERLSLSESRHIEKYRRLDAHGKKVVDLVTDEEYSRCEAERQKRENDPGGSDIYYV